MLKTILAMSLAGAGFILVVIIMRALFQHRLPRRLFYLMWMVALLRLLVPAFPPSPLSVFSAVNVAPSAPQTPAITAQAPAVDALTTAAASAPTPASKPNAALPAALPRTATAAPAPTQSAAPAPAAVNSAPPETPWLVAYVAVASALCVLLALLYVRGLRRFRASRPLESAFSRAWLREHPLRRAVRLRLCEAIDAPLTYGVLRPVILLPGSVDLTDEQALSCVLMHEWTHIRRLDVLFKALLALAACIHWFNPLVWAILALANRDIELSCDETALRTASGDSRRAYARALLRMEELRIHPAPLISAFGKSGVEERVAAIVKRRRTSAAALLVTLLSALLALAAFAASMPGEEAARQRPGSTPEPAAAYAGDAQAVSTPTPVPTPTPPEIPETVELTPLSAEQLAVYEPYGLRYTDGELTYNWQSVRVFADPGRGDGTSGSYLQNYHANTDVFAVRDENGALQTLGWSFSGREYYDANTLAIARTYQRSGLPTPTPAPAPTPDPTPLPGGEYEPWDAESATGGDAWSAASTPIAAQQLGDLSAYTPYGLAVGAEDTLIYMGTPLHFFTDEAAGVDLTWDTGMAGVYAVRDESGALTGLRVATWDEFAQRSYAIHGHDEGLLPEEQDTSISFGRYYEGWNITREALAAYEPFGLAWVEDMPVYLGVPIRFLLDSHAREYPWTISALFGNTDVYALRDANGNLVGLRASTREEFASNSDRFIDQVERGVGANAYYHATPATWPRAEAAAIEAACADYAPHGLRVENGIPFYWDVAVRFFVDEGAQLDLMCYYWGEVDVYAVRDESGDLTGLRPATRAEFAQKTEASWESLRADYASPATANMAYNWNWESELHSDADMVPVSLYEPYGLRMYDGRLYYGLEPVRNFIDEALGVDEGDPYGTGTVDLYAVRDENGELVGLRRASSDEYDANTQAVGNW